MEIERKYLIKSIPYNLTDYESHEIEQGYLSTSPVVRIRKKDSNHILTIKSDGLIMRHEIEKDLTSQEYEELSTMVKGNLITKTRYKIPYDIYTIELDIFHKAFEGLIYAEVEFKDIDSARSFKAPDYFGKDVTEEAFFQNSSLSKMNPSEIEDFITYAKQL
ncbi:MAG: CYTH domain-containing protein [Eubacterium sp.]|nr:CYTH domain-containing protein [Eubacterium sp.]